MSLNEHGINEQACREMFEEELKWLKKQDGEVGIMPRFHLMSLGLDALREGKEEYHHIVGEVTFPGDIREGMHELGQEMVKDYPKEMPIAVTLVTEAWAKEMKGDKLPTKRISEYADKKEIVLFSAMRLDAVGELHTYWIKRGKDKKIKLGKPDISKIEDGSTGDMEVLAQFFRGVADATLDKN